MQLVSITPVIAMLWVWAAFVAGITGMWMWNDSRQTMSESIQEARR
jgi:hypothetical protein